jgi:exonuclease III
MVMKFQGSKVSTSPSPMKILAWNCRGLARSPTIRALRALIRIHRPDMVFLSETKVSSSHFHPSLFGLGFSAWLKVPPFGFQGGLYLAWKQGVDIEPVRLDRNCIACLVYSDPSHCPWLFFGIYTPHTSQRREMFWSILSSLGNSYGGAWLLLGDFNSILSAAEKSGGREFGSASYGNFVDFVHSYALVDLGFVRNKYTWSNHRTRRDNIRERLDRGLANQNWVHLFPNALVNHLTATHSDHCPILVSTVGSYRNLSKPFRFEAFWTQDQSSHSVVALAWLPEVEESPAFSVSRKWKSTKNALKIWN